ncbi:MAG: WD40 repeat domain-containing protein [bacterium]
MSERAATSRVRICVVVALAMASVAVDARAARAGACAVPTGDRRRIVWTADDSGLIYNKGRGIEWMKLDGTSTTTLVEVPGAGALDFDLSPDGNTLAYTQAGKIGADCAGLDPEIRTLRIADRVAGRRLKEPKGHFTSVRFSPDGAYLAANLKDFGAKPTSQVLIYDQALNFIGRFDDWGGIVWRGDGRQLGIVSWNLISVWDSRAWEQIKSLRRPTGRIGQVAWSPNGAWLAVWVEGDKGCEVDASTSELVIFDATTWTVFKTIPQPGRCALELTWNPRVDAPVLAAFVREPLPKGAPANARPSYRIAVWNTRSWEEVGGSPTGQDRASDLAWSHSGERIAVGFDDVLVFELGDLGSPPGAANEPRSISDDVLPSSIAPPSTEPAPVAPVAPAVAPPAPPSPPAPRASPPAQSKPSSAGKTGKQRKP